MYDDIAAGYDELHGAEQRRKLQSLLERVDLSAVRSVADIGCGTAHLHTFFSDKEYVGIDPSAGLLAQAPNDVRTVCARGEDLPLPDASQDLVLSLTALHNYDDPLKGVAELSRVARGVVLVGILKKSASHDAIRSALEERFVIEAEIADRHDTLLVLHKP